MIGREFHGICLAVLLLHVNEEFGGAAGSLDVGHDGDEFVVRPLIRHLHRVGVVGGDGVGSDGEDALVFALERVTVLRAKETGHVAILPRNRGCRRRHGRR